MPAYIDLTTTRTTPPDPVAINAALKTATGDPTAVLTLVAPGSYRGKKAADWSAGDIAAAQNLLDTTAALTPQLEAQRFIDALSIFDKAIILTILDQFNLVRSKLSPPLGAITVAQMIQAIRDKAGTL